MFLLQITFRFWFMAIKGQVLQQGQELLFLLNLALRRLLSFRGPCKQLQDDGCFCGHPPFYHPLQNKLEHVRKARTTFILSLPAALRCHLLVIAKLTLFICSYQSKPNVQKREKLGAGSREKFCFDARLPTAQSIRISTSLYGRLWHSGVKDLT